MTPSQVAALLLSLPPPMMTIGPLLLPPPLLPPMMTTTSPRTRWCAAAAITIAFLRTSGTVALFMAAFVAAGVACARVVSSRLRAVDAASASDASGSELRRQMVVTTVVVFVAFVVRSVQSLHPSPPRMK